VPAGLVVTPERITGCRHGRRRARRRASHEMT
jgi:hypothetical protein